MSSHSCRDLSFDIYTEPGTGRGRGARAHQGPQSPAVAGLGAVRGAGVPGGSGRRRDGAAGVGAARVSGWTESDFEWDFRPPQRGVYPMRSPVLSNGFPFGLWTARRRLETGNQLLVWPRTVPLTSVLPVRGGPAAVAVVASRHAGDDGDFSGVRPYRQGDSPRRMHWAQTARHDQMIVCERQAATRRTVRILVDASRKAHVGDGPDGSMEWSIRVGASLVEEFHGHHYSVQFLLDCLTVSVAPGPHGLHRLLDQLARFTPSRSVSAGTPSSHANAPHVSGGRHRSQADDELLTIVVATDRAAELTERYRCGNGRAHLVLLRTAAGGGEVYGTAAATARDGPWIVLDDLPLIPSQLRREWERACHDGWNAA